MITAGRLPTDLSATRLREALGCKPVRFATRCAGVLCAPWQRTVRRGRRADSVRLIIERGSDDGHADRMVLWVGDADSHAAAVGPWSDTALVRIPATTRK